MHFAACTTRERRAHSSWWYASYTQIPLIAFVLAIAVKVSKQNVLEGDRRRFCEIGRCLHEPPARFCEASRFSVHFNYILNFKQYVNVKKIKIYLGHIRFCALILDFDIN